MMCDRNPFTEQPGVNPEQRVRQLGELSRDAILEKLVELDYSRSDLLGIELEVLQDGEPLEPYRWKADLGDDSSSGQQIVVSQELETYLVSLLEKARLAIRDYGTNIVVQFNLLLNDQNPYSLTAKCVDSCNVNPHYNYSHPHICQDNRLVKCCHDPC